MSYAYLLKYIIIGDTGCPKILSASAFHRQKIPASS
ncbi:hypothetical protein OROMI_006836 [Orobanche minor]